MTPTREQLASIEWGGVIERCPSCGWWKPQPGDPVGQPHHPLCWLAACLAVE